MAISIDVVHYLCNSRYGTNTNICYDIWVYIGGHIYTLTDIIFCFVLFIHSFKMNV